MEATHKASLAKGEVGIREKKPVPTLVEFAPRFTDAIRTVCAEKPATVAFYEDKLKHLLEYPPFATSRLDSIDEEAIDAFKQARAKAVSARKRLLSPASINRELATLRRLLRLAHEWKIINRVPRIRLLRGEKNREFVLTHEHEAVYLAALPRDLHDVAIVSDAGDRSAWGNFYEERGRSRGVMKAPDEGWLKAKPVLRPKDWNSYEILAQGTHIRLTFNGVVTIDTHDDKASSGIIALQLHAGEPMKVEFRNLKLKRLP